MLYQETNRHCRECICPGCDLFHTDSCLEGAALCDTKCDNTSHTGVCPWSNEENEVHDI